MFLKIDHLAIASADPKRLAEWYGTTLNFEMVQENSGAYFVEAQNGGMIEIVQATGERPVDEGKPPGLRHFAIGVEDFEAAFAQLQKHAVSFLGEPYEANGNRLVFFTDIDGNVLHLVHRSRPLK